MIIVCEKCQGKYNVPDEKIPAGKQIGFPCPKCQNRIAVMRSVAVKSSENEEIVFSLDDTDKPIRESKVSSKKDNTGADAFSFDEEDSEKPSISFAEDEESIYDSNDKPFDFVEEEYETALICETDPTALEKIKIALDLMEYSVTVAESTRDALRNMRYHTYDLVVLNEKFGTPNPDINGVLIYLNRLSMYDRRRITLILLNDRYRTMDPMAAFHRSANAVVNLKDMGKIDTILQKALNDNTAFYKIFKEYMVQAGRI